MRLTNPIHLGKKNREIGSKLFPILIWKKRIITSELISLHRLKAAEGEDMEKTRNEIGREQVES